MQFGYLPPSNPESGNLRTLSQFQDAIRNLQEFGNIPVTGVVDNATLKLMNTPRCGSSDNPKAGDIHVTYKRRKRFAVPGQKWDHTDLTWR